MNKLIEYLQGYKPQQYWENSAKTYKNEFYQRRNKGHDAQEHALVKALKSIDWQSCLEVGCGFGRLLEIAHSEFPENAVTGIDFAPTMLKNILDVPVRVMNAKNMDFQDNTFDVVYTCQVLLHVPPSDIKQVKAEMARVAKKWIIILEPSKVEKHLIQFTPSNFCFSHNHALNGFPGFRLVSQTEFEPRQYVFVFKKSGIPQKDKDDR